MKRIYIILVAWSLCWSLSAQTTQPNTVAGIPKMDNPADMWLRPSTTDFKTIVKEVEAYFEVHPENKKAYKKFNRWKWYQGRHLDENGQLTNAVRRNMDALKSLPPDPPGRANSGYWDEVGPTNYTRVGSGHNGGRGRVNVIAFHPSNPNIIYLGTPAGGLWRTTTGGNNWTPLTDGIPRVGVSGIEIQPNNASVIYILTGDGDGGDTQGVGVLKSTNGGATWTETGLSWTADQFRRGYKLLMHPTNYNILFAATNIGLYKTINGGISWTLELSGSVNDVEFAPGDPTIMYAARRSSTGFWRSTDTGNNWTQITSGLPTGVSRYEIGVTPADNNCIYLLAGPSTSTGNFKGVYRSQNYGVSFTTRATTPNILGYATDGQDDSDQSGYDLAIAVSPVDQADVLTGGINVWKSTNFGNTFTDRTQWFEPSATEYVHADIHELVYNPLNNWLYCGSDGGIFRSTDHGENWTDLSSGLQIMQFYHIDIDEGDIYDFIGGTQDNGTNYKTSNTTTINHIEGGDGFDSMIDWNNSSTLYGVANRSIWKSTNAGASIFSITPPGEDEFFPFLAQQHNAANTIFVGGNDVHRSTNGGTTWTNLGVNGEEGIVQGISFTGRFYATNGSTLWRSDNVLAGSPSWTTVSGNTGWLGSQSITDMCVDLGNSLNIFVTKGGYTANEKVLVSTNGGANWTNISAGLPNVPVLSIAYRPGSSDGIYVGTDIGVFYRDNTLAGWVPYRNGLPATMVADLEVNANTGRVYAGTHGRGLWSSSGYTDCPSIYFLTDGNLPGTSSSGYRYYQASDHIESSRNIDGGIGTEIHYKAANYVLLEEGFKVESNAWMRAWIGPCSTGVPQASFQGDQSEIQQMQMHQLPTEPTQHSSDMHNVRIELEQEEVPPPPERVNVNASKTVAPATAPKTQAPQKAQHDTSEDIPPPPPEGVSEPFTPASSPAPANQVHPVEQRDVDEAFPPPPDVRQIPEASKLNQATKPKKKE